MKVFQSSNIPGGNRASIILGPKLGAISRMQQDAIIVLLY
jgi:hypothetical protein